ncbi:hypothetical protein Mgra_00003352 [Meloidogyne graminicola]|uniref:Uncharacterized protein n=1 Tax=Meloidogyne graminicola TaxID=189291 RepID=A0A8S9ZV97_9BILA|nr:hypothetical protein Mgra_00003352 [Meloidogyne graminicola]
MIFLTLIVRIHQYSYLKEFQYLKDNLLVHTLIEKQAKFQQFLADFWSWENIGGGPAPLIRRLPSIVLCKEEMAVVFIVGIF